MKRTWEEWYKILWEFKVAVWEPAHPRPPGLWGRREFAGWEQKKAGQGLAET